MDTATQRRVKTWDDVEHEYTAAFDNVYSNEIEQLCFQHGVHAVFELLRREFPTPEFCKSALEWLAVIRYKTEAGLSDLAMANRPASYIKEIVREIRAATIAALADNPEQSVTRAQ